MEKPCAICKEAEHRRRKCLDCGKMVCVLCVWITAKDHGGPICRDCA